MIAALREKYEENHGEESASIPVSGNIGQMSKNSEKIKEIVKL